jgi:dTDP-glucose 4,6-dehydratase
MTFQPKHILVTGAAGFIGCNFVRLCLEHHKDCKVISLDKLTYAGNIKNLDQIGQTKRHTFVQGDICDAELIHKLLKEHNINTIVHFAAESHVDRSIASPSEFIQTNVMGTFTLLEAARQVWLKEKQWTADQCRFHHISTDEVYGTLSLTDPAFCETTPYAPNSPYSASKAGSDHLVRAYFHTYGLPVTTSNCSNNYGPYQHDEKLIPTVIRHALAHKPIPIYGKGLNVRDWLYVDDHATAILSILSKGALGEVYNIGGKSEWNNLNLVHKICRILDTQKPLTQGSYDQFVSFVTDRAGHDFRYAIDNTKIQSQLGWEPSYTLEQGLEKTVAFYVKKYS